MKCISYFLERKQHVIQKWKQNSSDYGTYKSQRSEREAQAWEYIKFHPLLLPLIHLFYSIIFWNHRKSGVQWERSNIQYRIQFNFDVSPARVSPELSRVDKTALFCMSPIKLDPVLCIWSFSLYSNAVLAVFSRKEVEPVCWVRCQQRSVRSLALWCKVHLAASLNQSLGYLHCSKNTSKTGLDTKWTRALSSLLYLSILLLE